MTPSDKASRATEIASLALARQRLVLPFSGLPLPFDAHFCAHVGEQAVKAWVGLLTVRDETGATRVTLAGLQRVLADMAWTDPADGQLTVRQLRRALERLRTLRLVADIGWEGEAGGAERFRRLVVGNVRSRKAGVEVLLPDAVRQGVEKADTRGGRRPGSGRRGGNQRGGHQPALNTADTPTDNHPTEDHQPALISSEPKSKGRTPARFDFSQMADSTGERIKAGAVEKNIEGEEGEKEVVFFPSEKRRGAARRFRPFGAEESGMAGEGLLGEMDGVVGLSGQRVAVALSAEAWSALPPFPGLGVVSPAAVPPPPKVRAEMSEEDRVALLLAAYNQTVDRLLPREFNPHARQALKAPDRKVLVKAAEALLQHEVSPLRWAEFSFAGWAKIIAGGESDEETPKGKKAARPALRWVFAPKRIEDRAGWARNEYERRGSTVIVTRTLRSLIARWEQMQASVLRGELTPAQAVSRYFPNDQYERLVEKARTEAQREQARVNMDLENGKYLW